jgi:hypothetical protein
VKGLEVEASAQHNSDLYKDFVEYYASSRNGRIDELPTVHSILNIWFRFSGYRSRIGSKFREPYLRMRAHLLLIRAQSRGLHDQVTFSTFPLPMISGSRSRRRCRGRRRPLGRFSYLRRLAANSLLTQAPSINLASIEDNLVHEVSMRASSSTSLYAEY